MSVPWKSRGVISASMGSLTAIEFDPGVELLWVGDHYGRLTSFTVQTHSENLVWTPYSSFSASNRPANGISFIPSGDETMVVVADREAIRGFKRGGYPLLCLPLPYDTQHYIDLFRGNRSTGDMFFTGNVGLTKLRLHDGATEHQTISAEDTSNLLELQLSDQYVVTGSSSGNIVVRDAKGLDLVGQVTLPSRSRVMSMDVHQHQIVAAYSERAATGSAVKVFDARKLGEAVHTVADIPSGNILQLRFYNDGFISQDRAILTTPQGYHVIGFDTESVLYSSTLNSDGACCCVAVSPSTMCAAVGTDKGFCHTLAYPIDHTSYVMSTLAQPVRPQGRQFAQSWVTSNVDAGFDRKVNPATLASSWPDDNYMILSVPQKMRCINAETHTVLHNEWGLIRADSYLPDPKDKLNTILPNPFPFNLQLGDDPSKVQAMLMELRKDRKQRHRMTRTANVGDYTPMDDALHVCYSIQHKFDWKSYNEIPHKVVGMDNSFPECWITPLLQCLYLCQPPEFPVRKVIIRHLCSRTYCMTCEIAFIFSNMMLTGLNGLGNKDGGIPPIAQVGNLIRTMRQLRHFSRRGIFERAKSRDDAVAKMHLTQSLMLETLHKDLQDQRAYPLLSYEAPSSDYSGSITSMFGTEFTSDSRAHVDPRFFWEVPTSALKVDDGLQHLLESCKDVQIKRLPPIIVLLLNPEHTNLKPPPSLRISRSKEEAFNYLLNSNIVHLADDAEDTGNFVSHQRIKDDNFALVNDYRVTAPMKISELERFIPALRSYSAVVTYYALDQLTAPSYAKGDDNRPPNWWHVLGPLLLDDVLSKPLQRYPDKQRFHSPLTSYTDIKQGDLIAIDAEYVVLKWQSRNEEEEELGIMNKRAHMALARVSCVLSKKDGDEVTILDDYVNTPEEIEDYVTQYSGIHPGDLDPMESTKNLTSLKATYLKLRALVDLGVVFVGHGLQQDFRVCNVAVPKKQIIDTLEIYHRHGARYLSLRYLAYHVLGESVQEDEHDSIEDARTSLRLYRRSVELKREGTFDSLLDRLMTKGAETSWFVPDRVVPTANTPPSSVTGSPVNNVELNDQTDGEESGVSPTTPGLDRSNMNE